MQLPSSGDFGKLSRTLSLWESRSPRRGEGSAILPKAYAIYRENRPSLAATASDPPETGGGFISLTFGQHSNLPISPE